MKKRIYRSRKDFFLLKDVLLPVFLLCGLLYMFVYGVGLIEKNSDSEQLAALEVAVQKAAAQCYAIEGQYPPNLEYISENYGVRYDDKKFVVHYDAFASNIMPNIQVMLVEAGGIWEFDAFPGDLL